MKYGEDYAVQHFGSTFSWICGIYRITNGLPYFVMLTRKSGQELRRIHDRMPLMLPEEIADKWICPSENPDLLIKNALTDMVAEKLD